MKVLTLKRWDAPLQDVVAFKHGSVELKKEMREAMWIHGGDYEHNVTNIQTAHEENSLWINGACWMSDSPHNALTVEADMKMLKAGSVVLGGLGMGIHLRYLLLCKDVDDIICVECRMDVIEAIEPTLPKDDRVDILCNDFFRFCEDSKMQYDNYYWDCFAGSSSYDIAIDAWIKLTEMKVKYKSNCNLIFHGAPSLNVLTNVIS